MLALALVMIGCDSIVDQQTEADTGIEASNLAGDVSVVQGSGIECIDPDEPEYK